LYERSTAFESLKHVSGWAGLYENSPDHHAIVGQIQKQDAQWVGGAPIFEAHSFSGHGVMQSYAVGEGLAEFICQGRYDSIDMTAWSASRFKSGTVFAPETWVI
jgi:sarcosine oxidase subunit beta